MFDPLMDNRRYRVKRDFVLSGFSFTNTGDSQDSREKEETMFISL